MARGYISTLGRLTPGIEAQLENARLAAEDTASQVQTSLLMLLETGGSAARGAVSDFKARLDQLQDQLVALKVELSTMADEATATDWSARLDATARELQALWGAVEGERKGALSSVEFRGLYWGLGAVAVATLAGFMVWRARKRRRSR
jgi:hypothetical protein